MKIKLFKNFNQSINSYDYLLAKKAKSYRDLKLKQIDIWKHEQIVLRNSDKSNYYISSFESYNSKINCLTTNIHLYGLHVDILNNLIFALESPHIQEICLDSNITFLDIIIDEIYLFKELIQETIEEPVT